MNFEFLGGRGGKVIKVFKVIKVVRVFNDEGGGGEGNKFFLVGRVAVGFLGGLGNKWIYWYVFFTNAVLFF
ncbi:MAG: hypothetical protein BHV69_08680 [Bacteroidales bacterium 52_46]|nr:MAG: hypothetical protein BHV69_08680 [Bacteroidales bacterium 52_46]